MLRCPNCAARWSDVFPARSGLKTDLGLFLRMRLTLLDVSEGEERERGDIHQEVVGVDATPETNGNINPEGERLATAANAESGSTHMVVRTTYIVGVAVGSFEVELLL